MTAHVHTNRPRERAGERDPKQPNSINPPKRSLKRFLKADFHHTEAFQVSTVCGRNGAEAFKLHALTFPLCYSLFLPVFSPLSLSRSLSLSLLTASPSPIYPFSYLSLPLSLPLSLAHPVLSPSNPICFAFESHCYLT